MMSLVDLSHNSIKVDRPKSEIEHILDIITIIYYIKFIYAYMKKYRMNFFIGRMCCQFSTIQIHYQ